MSKIEKLKWIPRLLDAYVEVRKAIAAHQQAQPSPPQPVPAEARHAQAPARKRIVKRRAAQPAAAHASLQETRRQLDQLQQIRHQLRLIEAKLERQLHVLEKRAVPGKGKQPRRRSPITIFEKR